MSCYLFVFLTSVVFINIIEKLLSKNPYTAILFGTLLTISVQSSSITTSLLVPMAGAGLLSLGSILPVTIGANIGTTTTALLASLTGNVAGLSIALVHFIFNILGTLIWFPSQKMRRLPIYLSETLAHHAAERKYIVRNERFCRNVWYAGFTETRMVLLPDRRVPAPCRVSRKRRPREANSKGYDMAVQLQSVGHRDDVPVLSSWDRSGRSHRFLS